MNRRVIAFSRFLLGAAVVFTANFLAGRLAPVSGSLRRFDLAYRPLLLLFVLVGFSILLSGFDRVPGNPLAALGLAMRPPWLLDLWAGGLLGAGMVAVAATAIALAGTLRIHVVVTGHTGRLVLLVIIILVTGAIAEEVSFRGYPFQRLIDAIGPTAAAIVLSLLFGAVHLANPHASVWGFLNTVLIGMLLAIAYLRTRSLWMPIGVHFGWNLTLGLVFGLPVSGLTEFAVITYGHARGPVWLTGGNYGIEASALGTAVVLLGLVALVVVVRPRRPAEVQPCISGEAESEDTASNERASNLHRPGETQPPM